MTDIRELEAEVKRLRARNEQLRKIRQAKIELLRLKLGNKFASFAAKHPILTAGAEQLYKQTKKGIRKLAEA